MNTLRIGFVGLGGICRDRHVPGFRRIEDVELHAVVNRSRESSERAAREFNIPVVCNSWEELVARDDIDLVVVGTWPYMHCPVSVAALEAGKHVFCQARMARDFAEARQMLETARRSSRVAGLCPVPFGLSVDATVARLMREETLGEIRLVRVQSFMSAYRKADVPMNWRKDRRLSGLNMGTLGMYFEVIHRWFGWTRSLEAQTQTFTSERLDENGERAPVEIPDQVLANAANDGAPAVQYVVATALSHGEDRIEIYGSEATALYDVGADKLTLAQAGSKEFKPVEIRTEEHYDVGQWAVEADFVRAVREGAPYHPDFEDGARYMQAVEAVYSSAESKREIALEDF